MVVANVVVVVSVVDGATELVAVVVADPSAVVGGANAVTDGSDINVVEIAGCDEPGGSGSVAVPPHPAIESATNGAVRRKPL